MAVTDYSKEREYGAVAAEEEQAADVEMAAMVGATEDAEAQVQVADAQAAVAEGTGQPQPEMRPPAFRPQNLMQVASPRLLYQKRDKSTAETQYDVGILWRVLKDDPTVSPMTKLIADRMTREEG